MNPGAARDQIGGEQHRPVRHLDLGEQQAGRMTRAAMKPEARAERRGAIGCGKLEAAAPREQVRHAGDERGLVTRVRRHRSLPCLGAHHVDGAGKHQLRGGAVELGQRAARVIEVQVREHHHIDVLGANADRRERFDQHVMRLDDAVALAQLRIEERADPGLEQDRLAAIAHDQATACERDAVLFIGRDPALPHRLRSVPEHRAAVEALRIPEDRGERAHERLFTTAGVSGPCRRPTPSRAVRA